MESSGTSEFPKVVGSEVKNFNVGELLKEVDLPVLIGNDEEPLKLFCSYAHEDETYKMQMNSHLYILHRQKVIQSWDDRQIEGGEE